MRCTQLIAALALGASITLTTAAPVPSEFTYQGVLEVDGQPVQTDADFIIRLYDGTILSGTPNFSCVYNTGAARYEILIDDEYYTYSDYVTTATPASRGRLLSVGSNSGRIIVDALRLSTDTYGECVFQFVTYKPGGAARVQGTPRPPLQPLMTPNDIDLNQRVAPLPDRVPVQDPKATPLPTSGN